MATREHIRIRDSQAVTELYLRSDHYPTVADTIVKFRTVPEQREGRGTEKDSTTRREMGLQVQDHGSTLSEREGQSRTHGHGIDVGRSAVKRPRI